MQYILTQQEYDDLKNIKAQEIKLQRDKLQALCVQIATTMPIKIEWHDEEIPWGCPLVKESQMEYCDECPVQSICPRERKNWSK